MDPNRPPLGLHEPVERGVKRPPYRRQSRPFARPFRLFIKRSQPESSEVRRPFIEFSSNSQIRQVQSTRRNWRQATTGTWSTTSRLRATMASLTKSRWTLATARYSTRISKMRPTSPTLARLTTLMMLTDQARSKTLTEECRRARWSVHNGQSRVGSLVVGYNRFGPSQVERARKLVRTILRRTSRAEWEDAADPGEVLGSETRELPVFGGASSVGERWSRE